MATIQQTLFIVINCPQYTPRIKGHIAKMLDYAQSLRQLREANRNRVPVEIRNTVMQKCWLSDVSALEFSFGEWEYGRLKSLITGCLRHNAEYTEHRVNIDHVAAELLNNACEG